MNGHRQPPEGAPRVTIDVAGVEWVVIAPQAIVERYAERVRERPGGWLFARGCGRCKQICCDVTLCQCCMQTKKTRPYDLNGSHWRVIVAADLVAKLEIHVPVERAIRRMASA